MEVTCWSFIRLVWEWIVKNIKRKWEYTFIWTININIYCQYCWYNTAVTLVSGLQPIVATAFPHKPFLLSLHCLSIVYCLFMFCSAYLGSHSHLTLFCFSCSILFCTVVLHHGPGKKLTFQCITAKPKSDNKSSPDISVCSRGGFFNLICSDLNTNAS